MLAVHRSQRNRTSHQVRPTWSMRPHRSRPAAHRSSTTACESDPAGGSGCSCVTASCAGARRPCGTRQQRHPAVECGPSPAGSQRVRRARRASRQRRSGLLRSGWPESSRVLRGERGRRLRRHRGRRHSGRPSAQAFAILHRERLPKSTASSADRTPAIAAAASSPTECPATIASCVHADRVLEGDAAATTERLIRSVISLQLPCSGVE